VFLDVFGITNLQLGTAFSLYGVIAMLSYFAGGPLADRFPARRLLVIALLATSAAGLLLANIPSLGTLTLLYAFWGLTTIFLFWAALIKTTRELGAASQGQAFGILDGGRGLFAALLSSVSVFIFAALLPEDVESASFAQRTNALGAVIYIFSGMGVVAALLVLLFIPDSDRNPAAESSAHKINLQGLKKIIAMRGVWLQAVIILCAYVAYKSTDDFSLYARDAFGYNEVQAVQLGTISFWMRPVAAITAGFLADRFNVFFMLLCSFSVVMLGSAVIASGMLVSGILWILILTIATTSAGIYALRGLYFAVMGEARIPLAYTGSAVGLVSFIGFTPDIFMGPLMGYLIDSSPGAAGHQHVFSVIFVFALLGFVASYLFKVSVQKAAPGIPQADAAA
tara:strand:+ start:10722 stop:11909 length:1188 start_codon:yes stop_codon:yes gene_type:complete